MLHFGFIDITSTVPASGTPGNVGFQYKAECTMSFKELVDPSTISLRMKARNKEAEKSASEPSRRTSIDDTMEVLRQRLAVLEKQPRN